MTTDTTGRYRIIVRGGGVVGLWQARALAEAGHHVRVLEQTVLPFLNSASWRAGVMLAPYCESEVAKPPVVELGRQSIAMWRDAFPQGLVCNGSLVVAAARDLGELKRFARVTSGHVEVDRTEIGRLEPAFAGRFQRGLHFPAEAHMQPHWALATMLHLVQAAGVDFAPGAAAKPAADDYDYLIDCRGIAARDELRTLRGVRGEMIIVRSAEIALHRPVRLLHPRFPLYIVPWPDDCYMIGATLIESDDRHDVTVRSALELLGAAHTVHPAFAEAEILKLDSHVRPAFPDNEPRIVVRGREIFVNGLYRHGFLLAPALAQLVVEHLARGAIDSPFVVDDTAGIW